MAVFPISVMLSVGLELTLARVRAVFRRPRTLLIGLGLNHLAVPALAVGFAHLVSFESTVAAGFLLCAAAPGSPFGVMLAQRANGDLAYGVSFLVVMTAINTVSTPGTLALAVSESVEGMPHAGAIIRTIAVFLLVPLAVGISIKERWPNLAARALPTMKLASNVIFTVLTIGLFITHAELAFGLGVPTFLAMLAFVALTMTITYLGASREPAVRTALSLVSGTRNVALAMLLASHWFDDPTVLVAVLLYALSQTLTGVVAAVLFARRRTGPNEESA